jgi:hypothetical protein
MRRQDTRYAGRRQIVLPRPIYEMRQSQIPDVGDYGTSLSDLSDSSTATSIDQNSGSTGDIMQPDTSNQLFTQ